MRLILAVVLLLVPVCLSAQEKGGKGPPPTPKNLKILTGESGEQVIMTMRAFRTALPNSSQLNPFREIESRAA